MSAQPSTRKRAPLRWGSPISKRQQKRWNHEESGELLTYFFLEAWNLGGGLIPTFFGISTPIFWGKWSKSDEHISLNGLKPPTSLHKPAFLKKTYIYISHFEVLLLLPCVGLGVAAGVYLRRRVGATQVPFERSLGQSFLFENLGEFGPGRGWWWRVGTRQKLRNWVWV